jgi:hypothetical protein
VAAKDGNDPISQANSACNTRRIDITGNNLVKRLKIDYALYKSCGILIEEEVSREYHATRRIKSWGDRVSKATFQAGRQDDMSNFFLTAGQCFFIGIVAFGLLGFIEGWRRAVILMAFTLAGILFLSLGGGQGLANIVFVRLPVVWQTVFAPSGHITTPPAPTPNQVFLTSLITFLVIVFMGYSIGRQAFSASASAGTPFGRFIGIIPGLVTGYFFVRYLTNLFGASTVAVGAFTPTSSIFTDNVPILFLVGIVAAVIGLITARVRRSGAKK